MWRSMARLVPSATKFESRNALEHYLLARPDLYGDETELPPIVLENGKMMEIS